MSHNAKNILLELTANLKQAMPANKNIIFIVSRV
jgi:hypothetical protein